MNNIATALIIYSVLSVTTWGSNELFSCHFSIPDLNSIAMVVFGQLTALHGINSVYNSNRGEKP